MTGNRETGPNNRIIQNRYELRSQLAKREEQRTLLAYDLQANTPVVIKFLLFQPDLPPDRLDRLQRAAETLKALFHPAIPRYLDYFVMDLAPYKTCVVVQEYVEAKSLKECLKAGQVFTEATAKKMARNLLDILAYLHGLPQPLIHSNIKSSNVLLGRMGDSDAASSDLEPSIDRLYLIDFGSLQAAVTPDDSSSRIASSFIHVPPEQFAGRPLIASDLYALGMTLIDAVTPIPLGDIPRKNQRLLFEDVTQLSPGFVDWLKRITAPDIAFRFPSVQVALDALEKLPTAP